MITCLALLKDIILLPGNLLPPKEKSSCFPWCSPWLFRVFIESWCSGCLRPSPWARTTIISAVVDPKTIADKIPHHQAHADHSRPRKCSNHLSKTDRPLQRTRYLFWTLASLGSRSVDAVLRAQKIGGISAINDLVYRKLRWCTMAICCCNKPETGRAAYDAGTKCTQVLFKNAGHGFVALPLFTAC